MRKFFIVLTLLILVCLGSVGCSYDAKQTRVVASFYPLQFISERLLGEEVLNITPVGVEPHEFEISADKAINVEDADLVISMGKSFAPSIDEIAKKNSNSIFILDELSSTKNSDDPHFWLDPVLMNEATKIVKDKIIAKFPESKNVIEKNYKKLNAEYETLNLLYSSSLKSCETKTLITSHDAFGYLANRYGLTQESIAGYSPENEPSPEKLSKLVDLANDKNVKVIFSENLVSDKLSKALAKELNIRTETLNAIEFLNDKNIENREDYFSLMKENLKKLKLALGCS